MVNPPVSTDHPIAHYYLDGVDVSAGQFINSCPTIDLNILQNNIEPIASSEKNCLAVIPNPFHDQATLRTDLADPSAASSLRIVNLLGDVVMEKSIKGRSEVISRGNLPDGIYFYELRVESGRTCYGKFVIK